MANTDLTCGFNCLGQSTLQATFCCLYALLEMFSFNQEYSHFFAKRYNLLRRGTSWGMKLLRLECWLYICINWLRLCKSLEVVSKSNQIFIFLWKVCNFLIQLLLSHLTEKTKSWSTSFGTVINCYFHMNSCSWLRICTCSWK